MLYELQLEVLNVMLELETNPQELVRFPTQLHLVWTVEVLPEITVTFWQPHSASD